MTNARLFCDFMTTPNPLYVPLYTLSQGSVLDKDSAQPLSAGIVRFYRDSSRNTFKEVYQLTGTSPNYTFVSLGYTLTLSDIGTFVDDQGDPVVPYLYPYDTDGNVDLYYATCYSSLDGVTPAVFQFDVEAIPHLDDSDTENAGNNFDNELSNPQFVDVLFYPTNADYTYTLSGSATVSVAPNWDIVVSGAGSLTVKRVAITPGDIPTNPPYALEVNSTGFSGSDITLRQRIYRNSYIFTNGALSGYFIVNAQDATSHTLTMTFNQSNGTPSGTTIATGSATSGGAWVEVKGSVTLPVSTSSDTAEDGYIDIDISIPIGAHIQITSLQLISTDAEISDENNVYDQQTIYRQQDHLAHYYKPQLAYKPIPSYTVGWDFPFNPCQELGPTVSATALGANKSRYIADQTIAFEAVSNVLSYSFSQVNGLTVTTTGSNSAFALVQYLDAREAKQLLLNTLSVKIRGNTSLSTLNAKVTLWWTADATLPVVSPGTNNSLVATLSGGKPATFNGTWTEVPRGYFNDASFQLNTTLSEYDFTGWNGSAGGGAATATYFAIVIGFATMATTQTATIQYCTLMLGDIATPPPAMSEVETLTILQQYYEKSYDQTVLPGANTAAGGFRGALIVPQYVRVNGGTTTLYPTTFFVPYNTPKRTIPGGSIYDPNTGTVSNLIAAVNTDGTVTSASVTIVGNWNAAGLQGTKGSGVASAATGALVSHASGATINFGYLTFQHVSDARLGVV